MFVFGVTHLPNHSHGFTLILDTLILVQVKNTQKNPPAAGWWVFSIKQYQYFNITESQITVKPYVRLHRTQTLICLPLFARTQCSRTFCGSIVENRRIH